MNSGLKTQLQGNPGAGGHLLNPFPFPKLDFYFPLFLLLMSFLFSLSVPFFPISVGVLRFWNLCVFSIFGIIGSKCLVLVQLVLITLRLWAWPSAYSIMLWAHNETNPSWYPLLVEKHFLLDQTLSTLHQRSPILAISVVVCHQKCGQLRQQRTLPKIVRPWRPWRPLA